jgi:hypothetical protein
VAGGICWSHSVKYKEVSRGGCDVYILRSLSSAWTISGNLFLVIFAVVIVTGLAAATTTPAVA